MISVCMTSYNGEKYIGEQIESIILQITQHDEILISDDGSTDNTLGIIEQFQDKYSNIKLFKGPQKGVIKNFEYVLKMSKGDIIFLSDQDDIWEENKIHTVLDAFNKFETSMVMHDAYIVDSNNNIIQESFYSLRNSKKGLINNIIKNSYSGNCMAFSRDILNFSIPFPDKIPMHDSWIGLLAEIKGNTIFLPDKLIRYRRHENNVSDFGREHTLLQMIKIRIYVLKQLLLKLRNRKMSNE